MRKACEASIVRSYDILFHKEKVSPNWDINIFIRIIFLSEIKPHPYPLIVAHGNNKSYEGGKVQHRYNNKFVSDNPFANPIKLFQ